MIKKIIILVSLSVVAFAQTPPPALVNTTKVVKGVVNPLEEFIGTLEFSKTSALASQTNGAVVKMNFESGDKVRKGETLLKVDSKVLDAQIKSSKAGIEVAKTNLEDAKKNYNRYKELIEKKSISQKLYDDSYFKYTLAKSNLNIAKAKLDELLINKSYKSIKAPFNGLIVEKNIELSEWVSAGKTVATIVATNEIDLIFNLPTSYIYKLDKNENYNIDLKDKTITSKLYANIAKGDKKTRTFPVKFKAKVKDEFLYDGMEVKINLPRSKKRDALMVPRDAVIKRFGQSVIFLDVDGVATMMPVQIVGYTKKSIAIDAQGLKAGAMVVVKGNERIFPNQPIKSLDKK